jgi:hypothetical protein
MVHNRRVSGLDISEGAMKTSLDTYLRYEGREIWLAQITNPETGPPSEKPAFRVDGNAHAGEVTGSMAALYLIETLLEGYGSDERITRLRDRQLRGGALRLAVGWQTVALSRTPRPLRRRPSKQRQRANRHRAGIPLSGPGPYALIGSCDVWPQRMPPVS